jgi:SAM-dependent MidA family methyltransferase
VHLIERSEALRKRQAETLSAHRVTWHADVSAIPPGPMLLVANEFLDALPIKQFVRIGNGWAERHVDVRGGAFVFVDRPASSPPDAPADVPIGGIVEHAPAVVAFTRDIATRLVRDSGAALLIDYGYAGPAHGDTLQAVKAHKFHPVLDDLGSADITAHVDFGAVKRAAQSTGARALGPEPQGTWLANLGLKLRVAHLTRNKPAARAAEIAAAANRLSAPDAMGLLFKVLAVAHPSLATLDGFAQDAAP